MTTLAELEERRAYECRLTPARALASLDEAEEFLLDRGLLTRTVDSALPSLFEACHEEPYAHESPVDELVESGRLGRGDGHLAAA
jgi:hypothetical protein